jgi:hypothetical protein
MLPIIADESKAGIGVLPPFPVEVFADDSPHAFPVHSRNKLFTVALQS